MSSPTPEPPRAGPSLASGDRLGPYEIVALLGTGGMGEVYRARDPRLRRDVAVKILHSSLDITPERVARLTREARAAGGLNHPNIVGVFDVGTEGSRPYIVSELLEGESLRRRLDRGPLPYRKALEYGIQIAEALGAAHEKGVWHRDVKPANAFITSDGRIKLLDFGLVKVREPQERPLESTTEDTRPGSVLGTLGYMSPEQVLGDVVDHRTDIFALGAVLYEMFVGAPAFRKQSTLETMRALLNEDPPDMLERKGDLPPTAAAVVRRCLDKNREERFQSARDLAFHLRQLQEMTTPPRPGPSLGAKRRRLGFLGLLGVTAIGVAWLLFHAFSQPEPRFEQLTFRRARIGGARFASSEGAVVYSESRDGKPPDVWWVGGPDSLESRPLGHSGSDVLAVRAGKLALSTGRRFNFGERFVGTLAEAPLGEGSPHELVDNVEDADWDPSGKQLAVVRSTSSGGETRLEYPAGRLLHKTAGSISCPRFSRDGRRIAFWEDPTGRAAGGKVVVVDLQGRSTPLTEIWGSARGLAWSPIGSEVWFAAGESRNSRTLRGVDLRRRQRVILQSPTSLTLWDIAHDGRVLLTRDDERGAIVGVPPGETAERDLSWFDSSAVADLSEDGRMLMFQDRYGLYIRRTDGAAPVHLGLKDGFGDDFAPDGKRLLATTASGDQLMILPAGPGEAVPLPNHGILTHRGALWLPDGRRIVFNGAPPGKNARSYVQDLDGGAPRALTPENTWVRSISADGRWAAATGPDQGISLWSIDDGRAPRQVASSRPGDRPEAWSVDGRWLWVFRRGELPAEVAQLEIETGQRRLWKKLQPPDPSGVYTINEFRITRDGRSYFYSYKRVLSQLYTATGLR